MLAAMSSTKFIFQFFDPCSGLHVICINELDYAAAFPGQHMAAT